jgi:hypothetical protein
MPLSMGNLFKKQIPVVNRKSIIKITKQSLRQWIFSNAIEKLGFKIKMVTREELFNNSEKYNVLPFGFEESIVVSEPYNNPEALPWSISSTIGTFTLKKPFVFEVKNAELVGPATVGFDRNGSLISEIVIGTPTITLIKYLPAPTLILKNLPSFGSYQLDRVYSLVNPWSNGYFHWIVDCLARLEGIEYYQEQTGKKPTLLIESNPPKWKIESLRLLGYDPDDCIYWNRSKIKVKRLVVPSYRREHNVISPAACQWLRQRMLSNLPNVESKQHSFSPRIYISRPQTTGRQVINEDDVLEALKPFGFVAYILENMSFADQVRLFSQAEIVVAPHGAGLTNMIFAQNLIVIDLFGSYGNPCFLVLAKALGFHYGCLGSGNNGGNSRTKKSNGMIVDIPKLRDLVAQMLNLNSDRQPANTA